MSSLNRDERYLGMAILEISKALSSTLELDKVLNLSLDLLENLINYSCGIVVLTGKKTENIVFRGVEEKKIVQFKKKYLELLIRDVESDLSPKIYQRDKLKFKLRNETTFSLLFPLCFEAKLIGFMYFEHEREDLLSSIDLHSISVLSSQIAVAIKNAQLFEEIKIRVSELTALYEITRKLSSILDYTRIVEIIVDFTCKYFGADFVFLWRWDDTRGKLVLLSQHGCIIPPKDVELKIGEGIAGSVAKDKTPLFVSNLDKITKTNEFKFIKPVKGSAIASSLALQDKIIGAIVIVSCKRNNFSEEDIRMLSILSSIFAISMQNAKLYCDNEMLAITDGLCEIYNHRFFQEKLQEEIKRSTRYKKDISLVMIDIDNFKTINDRFGHIQGDMVLKQVASILKNGFRETDFVCRYGGEEFAVILPETNATGAIASAERLKKIISESRFPTIRGNRNLRLNVSCGVSSYPQYASDRESLIKKADSALYKAKKLGKNRVCLGV